MQKVLSFNQMQIKELHLQIQKEEASKALQIQ